MLFDPKWIKILLILLSVLVNAKTTLLLGKTSGSPDKAIEAGPQALLPSLIQGRRATGPAYP
jgi:hypothetical protein